TTRARGCRRRSAVQAPTAAIRELAARTAPSSSTPGSPAAGSVITCRPRTSMSMRAPPWWELRPRGRLRPGAILLVSWFQKKPSPDEIKDDHVASCAMRPAAVQKPGLAIPEEDPMTVRVALAQFSGHIDKNINIEKAESLARQAAGNGAKVVCFPELCTTIYFCFDRDKKWFETAEPVPGPAVDRLRRVAKETGTVIVYPLYENDGGVLYNTAVVIGPDGEIIGKYRKMSIPQILRTVKAGETP